jgi:hypothetical protein
MYYDNIACAYSVQRGGGDLSSEKYRYIEEKYIKKKKIVSGLYPKVGMTKMHILAEFGTNTIKTGVSGFF